MSKLFMKHGVIIKAIRGSTYFGKKDGSTVKSGICCWFFGNWKEEEEENQKRQIEFSYYDDEPEYKEPVTIPMECDNDVGLYQTNPNDHIIEAAIRADEDLDDYYRQLFQTENN